MQVMAAHASRTRCERRPGAGAQSPGQPLRARFLAALALPLWLVIGLALVVFGVALPGTANAQGCNDIVAPAPASASERSVGVAIAVEQLLRDRAAEPSRLVRDDRDSSVALGAMLEGENESEDDYASETFVPASAVAHAHSEELDPRRSSALGCHRRWVSTGLGRGPPRR
jgi:hypothetical protein